MQWRVAQLKFILESGGTGMGKVKTELYPVVCNDMSHRWMWWAPVQGQGLGPYTPYISNV